MGELSFKNSLRLHYDSIILFRLKSYPSAYFLSILALEELGKTLMLDDFIYHTNAGEFDGGKYDYEFLQLLYSHRYKQGFLFSEVSWRGLNLLNKEFLKIAKDDNRLEAKKQNAVYVGLERLGKKINLKGKITSPFKINREKASKQITFLNDIFLDYATGRICDFYGEFDNENVDVLFNRRLRNKLLTIWKNRSQKVKRKIKKFESLRNK